MAAAGFELKPGETPIVPVLLGDARLAQDLPAPHQGEAGALGPAFPEAHDQVVALPEAVGDHAADDPAQDPC